MRFVLDAGHGGIAFGHYMTRGKRSPEVPPGIYEGEFNRDICARVGLLYGESSCVLTAPGALNPPLKSRVDFVNTLQKHFGDVVLISIHANADGLGKDWTGARGHVVFTHKNRPDAGSDRLASLISGELAALNYTRNRGVKKAAFSVLNVRCPAVLVECGFMTNSEDVATLANAVEREMIAAAIVDAMRDFAGGVS